MLHEKEAIEVSGGTTWPCAERIQGEGLGQATKGNQEKNGGSSKINNRKQKIVVAWPCAERSQGEDLGQAIKGDQEKKGGWLMW